MAVAIAAIVSPPAAIGDVWAKAEFADVEWAKPERVGPALTEAERWESGILSKLWLNCGLNRTQL
jgi:hypothetical protein